MVVRDLGGILPATGEVVSVRRYTCRGLFPVHLAAKPIQIGSAQLVDPRGSNLQIATD